MKRGLFFTALFLCIGFVSFSQVEPKPTPQDRAAEQEMLKSSKNGYTIQFLDMRILFVDSVAKEFMSKKMNMVHSDESKKELSNRIYKYYVLYTSRKDINDVVRFEYTVRPGGSFFYVKDLIVSGDLDDMVKFYNLFWEKSAKKADLKGGDVVLNEYLKDKISLSYNAAEKQGFIKIVP